MHVATGVMSLVCYQNKIQSWLPPSSPPVRGDTGPKKQVPLLVSCPGSKSVIVVSELGLQKKESVDLLWN